MGEDISFSQYFSSNPDRRKRVFNQPLGVYQQNCGLDHLRMSWGAPEYLYTVLGRSQTDPASMLRLPREALFLIRYQRFFSLESSRHYHNFMSQDDMRCLEMLFHFQKIVEEVSSWTPFQVQQKSRQDQANVDYCKTLTYEYFPRQME